MSVAMTRLLERLRLTADPGTRRSVDAALRLLTEIFARLPVDRHETLVEQLQGDLRDDADPAVRRLRHIVLPASVYGVAVAELRRRKEGRPDAKN